MDETRPAPFLLGMFTVSGSPAFPALILDDEAAIAIDAVAPLAARLGMALTGKETVFGLLQNWDHNAAALAATVDALADAATGKYFRSALTASEFLTPCAPLETPRQILVELTGTSGQPHFVAKLQSAIAGPKAKIHLPQRSGHVVAEAKIGLVIGRPIYQVDPDQAEQAIAGYVTATDLTLLSQENANWMLAKSQPCFLPIGPYFVPRISAGIADALAINIAVNGERSFPSTLAHRAENLATSLSRLSQDIQLFPGDLVCCGVSDGPSLSDLPPLGDGDIIETAIHGLGQQTLNSMRTSGNEIGLWGTLR